MRNQAPSLLFFIAMAAVLPASAEEVRLSLQEALDRALSGNQALLATRERAKAAHSRADITNRISWPRVSLTSQWSRTDNAAMVFMGKLTSGVIEERDFVPAALNDPRSRSQMATKLSVEAPIDAFGRVRPLKDASRALASSADATSHEHALELRYRVAEIYSRAAISLERESALAAAVAAARSREAEVEAQVSEGAALRADLLRVRTRRREHEAELATHRADRAGALAAMNELLGADAETTYVPSDLPSPALDLLEDDSVLLAKALSNRPALEALRLQAEAASHAAQADHKARLPELGVFAQLTDDRGGFSSGRQSYAVGGFLRVSLFDPAKDARQAEAQLTARAAELDRLAALDGVRRAVRSAREQVLSRRASVDAARGSAEEGQEALRVIQERRREGLATLTDELETEAAALRSRLRELTARVELSIAQASLTRVTGETK